MVFHAYVSESDYPGMILAEPTTPTTRPARPAGMILARLFHAYVSETDPLAHFLPSPLARLYLRKRNRPHGTILAGAHHAPREAGAFGWHGY